MAAVEPRYAEALFLAAEDSGVTEEIGAALEEFSGLMNVSHELSWLMLNPVIPAGAKKETLVKVLPETVPVYAKNFLFLLIDKGRLAQLPGILAEYGREKARRNGVLEVTVTSAQALEQRQLEEIAEFCRNKYKAKQVEVKNKIDASLLGGVRIQAGDELIDDTLYDRLKRLGAEISAT